MTFKRCRLTDALFAVGGEPEAAGTRAKESARPIGALSVASAIVGAAFVHVWTGTTERV